MQYRTLGLSDTAVPLISFGAGPISGLMVGDDADRQLDTIARAVELGIDYFDTAATYGEGRSEAALGAALRTLNLTDRVRIATKVRLMPEHLNDIPAAIRASLDASCHRLGIERVTVLQLHNSITTRRGDLPTSLSVADVLGEGGVADEFARLRSEGRVEQIGFTGLGDRASLEKVIRDGPFVAAQVPLNILLPISETDASAGSIDVDYLQLAELCREYGVGVIAIRLFAGGALVDQQPSPHTYKTKFFTLDVYKRDRLRAAQLADILPEGVSRTAAGIRYVTGNLPVATAAIGFASPEQVEEAVALSDAGPLSDDLLRKIQGIQGLQGDRLDD